MVNDECYMNAYLFGLYVKDRVIHGNWNEEFLHMTELNFRYLTN